jgi:hypothetical protein
LDSFDECKSKCTSFSFSLGTFFFPLCFFLEPQKSF